MAMRVQSQPGTAEEVLAAADGLGPSIAERAAEIEAARQLPGDLLADLVDAGCFRLLLPRSHGGVGADLPASMRVVESLSRADASVGWTVMIGSGAWLDLVGLPRATFDGLFANGADVMIAGVFSPSGVAVPGDGAYRVSGRWGFASGCRHAAWLYGNCIEETGGEPRLRIALFALDEAQIEDTWHVMGLRGTGSHHFHVDNVVVPADRTWAILEDAPLIDEPIARIPLPALFALAIGAAAIGIAHGALDDITMQATTRVPLFAGAPLAQSVTFHRDLAAADTDLRAARALLYESAEEAWTTALDGSDFALEQRGRMRAAAASAAARAADVVTVAYRAGGGSALYLDNTLQRRFRDIHTLAQHFLVRADTLTTVGAVLTGQTINDPVF